MTDEFYYDNTPAVQFHYAECGLEKLERLTRNAQEILSLLEHTKKSVAALELFQARPYQNRVVRRIKQSHSANIVVNLVTYLPLLEVKADALQRITELFSQRPLSPRWGTYCTYLTCCNQEWAKLSFNDVQGYFQATAQTRNLMPPEQTFMQTTPVCASAHSTDLPPAELEETYSRGMNSQSSPFTSEPLAVADNEGAAANQHQVLPQPSNFTNDASPGVRPALMVQNLGPHLRAPQTKEKGCGLNHPTTLDTAADLGRLYASQDYLVEAREIYQRAAAGSDTGRRLTFGVKSIQT